jgi:hypothetical protein
MQKAGRQCNRLAAGVQAPARRKQLLALAQQWVRLAERTEQLGPAVTDNAQDPPS